MRAVHDFCIRSNNELYVLLNDIDVVQCINIWRGQVVQMPPFADAPARRVFDEGICGSRRRGRPCICCKDQIEEALSLIGVIN